MESSAVARYQGFFGAYQQVKQGASDAYRSKIAQFMGQVTPFVQSQKEVRRQTAPRFNLFEALRIAHKEQVQSRFLAFLLDPTESHDQGDMFLRTFLEYIQLPESLPQRLDGAVAKTERGIAPYGRVDIAITLPDRRIIVIENKVDASEGEEQIARYQDWLRSKPQPTHGQHLLVFLTPEGMEPQTGSLDSVLPVSYRQLGD
jgi:PD-(D/E)XK nuclease superfamily protein